MPAEIAGEVLGGVLRFIARIVFELVFELIIQGTGRAVLHTLRPQSRPGEMSSVIVGLLVWGVLIGGGVLLYLQLA